MTSTQPVQKQKRTYTKKTQNQKSDFESLSFTELVEKAQWHRTELKKIEDFLQEGFNKVLPLTSKSQQVKERPPFTQGYNLRGFHQQVNPTNPNIAGTITYNGIFNPGEVVSNPVIKPELTEMKVNEQVIKGIEPKAEVFELADESSVLEEVRGLLNTPTDLTKLPY